MMHEALQESTALVPIKDGKNALQRIGIGAQNVLSCLGFGIPKFVRKDENGKKVFDARGFITLGGDALAVAGYGLGAAGLIAGTIAPFGLGLLGAAAVRTVARGVIIGKTTLRANWLRKHKDLDNPNPYTKESRSITYAQEVAREKYYREQGHLFPEFEATLVDTMLAGKKKATHKKIVEKQNGKTDAQIEDSYIAGAKMDYAGKQAAAHANQAKREETYSNIAEGQDTYRDIVREPEATLEYDVSRRVTQTAGLGLGGMDYEYYFRTTSKKPRNTQYVKKDEQIEPGLHKIDTAELEYTSQVGKVDRGPMESGAEMKKNMKRDIAIKDTAIEMGTAIAAATGLKVLFAKLFPKIETSQVYKPGETQKTERQVERQVEREVERVDGEKVKIKQKDYTGTKADYYSTGSTPEKPSTVYKSRHDTIGAIEYTDPKTGKSWSVSSDKLYESPVHDGPRYATHNPETHPSGIALNSNNSGEPVNRVMESLNQCPEFVQATRGMSEAEKIKYLEQHVKLSIGTSKGTQAGWTKFSNIFETTYTPNVVKDVITETITETIEDVATTPGTWVKLENYIPPTLLEWLAGPAAGAVIGAIPKGNGKKEEKHSSDGYDYNELV